jgi:hypothetical protein
VIKSRRADAPREHSLIAARASGLISSAPKRQICVRKWKTAPLLHEADALSNELEKGYADLQNQRPDRNLLQRLGHAMLSSKLIKDAQLKVYKGAPHGLCTTMKDRVNEDLLAFAKS